MAPTPAQDDLNPSADKAQPEICVICQENITSPCEALPCGHKSFDYPCLSPWLEFRATCPLCKGTVNEVRYISQNNTGQTEFRTYTVPGRHNTGLTELRTYTVPALPLPSPFQSRREAAPSPVEEWFRRRSNIYDQNLYALHVGSNRRQVGESQYTELSPQLFMADPELVSRARTWLQRELRIFSHLHTDVADPNNIDLTRPTKAEWVREFTIFLLKTVDIQGHSNLFEDQLSVYLGRETARHLLHELRAFLRSPFERPEEWDRVVQYPVEHVNSYETVDRSEWEDREESPRRKQAPRHGHCITKRPAKTPRNRSHNQPLSTRQ